LDIYARADRGVGRRTPDKHEKPEKPGKKKRGAKQTAKEKENGRYERRTTTLKARWLDQEHAVRTGNVEARL
jgi:hypothetical protein